MVGPYGINDGRTAPDVESRDLRGEEKGNLGNLVRHGLVQNVPEIFSTKAPEAGVPKLFDDGVEPGNRLAAQAERAGLANRVLEGRVEGHLGGGGLGHVPERSRSNSLSRGQRPDEDDPGDAKPHVGRERDQQDDARGEEKERGHVEASGIRGECSRVSFPE